MAFAQNTYLGDHHLYVPFRQTKSKSTNPKNSTTVFFDDPWVGDMMEETLHNAKADKWWLNHTKGETKGAEMYYCPEDKLET